MRGYKPSKQGRQIHLQLMSSCQTYCDLIVRRYWNSPCQNKFVTGTDITEHLPQLKLQLADGSHSALNTNVVMVKNTIKICRLISSIKSILYQLLHLLNILYSRAHLPISAHCFGWEPAVPQCAFPAGGVRHAGILMMTLPSAHLEPQTIIFCKDSPCLTHLEQY